MNPRPTAITNHSRTTTLIVVILAAAAALVAAIALHAQNLGQYETLSATGTTNAQVIFPAVGTLQANLVGLIATSDKAASVISIRAGTTAYAISASNTAATTTITVARTNGLAAADVVLIQRKNRTTAAGTISSISRTNLTLSAASGIDTAPGDALFKLGPSTDLKVGAAANISYQGTSIKASPPGRPLRILVDGTSACSVDAASVKWE